jgi:hypothetical protein
VLILVRGPLKLHRENVNATYKIARFLNPIAFNYPPVLLVILLLSAVLHLLCGVSINQTIFLMEALKSIVSEATRPFEKSSGSNYKLQTSRNASTVGIPGDVRGSLKALELDPKTDTFACCPQCFSLYPIGPNNEFTATCEYQPTPDVAVCGTKLSSTRRVKGRLRNYPSRRFIRQDFHDWLGRLLCRPGMEDLMDSAVETASATGTGPASDIWDAPVLHTIKLPDGRPFLEINNKEGRYVFSICIDGLLPHGKGSGPAVSVGSIFFVCLNLPPHLRYRFENMYLAGVIPGPKHPSKEQINNILHRILEPFRESYDRGIFYTSTPSHPDGKTTVSIVLPLVADTLSAHQMNGNAHFSHKHGCPFCTLKMDELENLDPDTWPRRNAAEHVKIAQKWLSATTIEERDSIYETTGIRWSELLTLPYWNPISHLAIDLMHNLFLGLLAYFITSVWGMSSDKSDGLDGITQDPQKKKPSSNDMEDARRIVRHEDLEVMRTLRVEVLREVAKELGVQRWKGKKSKVLKHLQDVVSPH